MHSQRRGETWSKSPFILTCRITYRGCPKKGRRSAVAKRPRSHHLLRISGQGLADLKKPMNGEIVLATRSKLMIALFVVVVIIGILIRTAITHASTYYLTVSQLHNEGTKAVGQQATVSGQIVGATVNWDPTKSLLEFTVKDTSGSDTIPVVFHGAKPDDFSNNWPVIVTGTLKQGGKFQASKLLIKCPSKYQAKTKTIVVKSS